MDMTRAGAAIGAGRRGFSVQIIAPCTLALMVAGCASAEPIIVSSTPASVEIECIGLLTSCRSPQAVADAAQAYCQRYGLNAQEFSVARAPSGNERAMFNCVAAGGAINPRR